MICHYGTFRKASPLVFVSLHKIAKSKFGNGKKIFEKMLNVKSCVSYLCLNAGEEWLPNTKYMLLTDTHTTQKRCTVLTKYIWNVPIICMAC